MKKIWMSLLALTLVLGLIGCGSQTAQSEARSPAAEKPAENSAQEEANGATDGSMVSCCPAEDSCGVVFANGSYYRYAHGNEAFWSLFDVKLSWM